MNFLFLIIHIFIIEQIYDEILNYVSGYEICALVMKQSKCNMINTLIEVHHKFSVKILIPNVHFLVC